jgi:hypothetical protein
MDVLPMTEFTGGASDGGQDRRQLGVGTERRLVAGRLVVTVHQEASCRAVMTA